MNEKVKRILSPFECLLKAKPITEKVLSAYESEKLALAMKMNLPAEITDEMLRQAIGGTCPECGKPYVAKKAYIERVTEVDETGTPTRKIVWADFDYYEPRCWRDKWGEWKPCIERIRYVREPDGRVVKTPLIEAESNFLAAEVPERYLGSSFDTWDYRIDEANDRSMKAVYQWAHERKWEREGLVLTGKPGSGKTHCAVAVLRLVSSLRPELPLRFVAVSGLVSRLIEHSESDYLQWILAGSVVVLDDIDKISASGNEWVQAQVFHLIDTLTARSRSPILTSNLAEPAMVKFFGETVLSRLVGSCSFVRFEGSDYRIKRRRDNVVKFPDPRIP